MSEEYWTEIAHCIDVYHGNYTVELVRQYPHKLFVFGDNMLRYGKGGQAIIRSEPNAFGVATKRSPSMDSKAFFSDQTGELNCVRNDLRRLYVLSKESIIVFPKAGIGTGLARMQEKSPKIWEYMNGILLEHFGFENNL